MKKLMAVYDTDPMYAERLSDYVNRKEKGVFSAQAFTSREKLMDFAKDNEIDVLLTGEPVESQEMRRIPSRQKIHLTEERTGCSEQEIYKYQSGDDIIREVMTFYCDLPGTEPTASLAFGKQKRLIGVFSPVGRCGKTCLALSIGQLLAKEEKVLFVSLDTFTGFPCLFNERWKRDLSDLIYYYKLGRFNGIRLNSLVYYLGDMAWLPPIRFPDDYSQVSAEEMADLMQSILRESSYTTLVLDVGDYGRQVLPLLEICQVVYMPMKEDAFSLAKLREFEEYVETSSKNRVKEKLQKIHVPMVTGGKRMEHCPQELLWSDMGDFVRGLLKGQRDIWDS